MKYRTNRNNPMREPPKMAGYTLTDVSLRMIRGAEGLRREPGEAREEWLDRLEAAAGRGAWRKLWDKYRELDAIREARGEVS